MLQRRPYRLEIFRESDRGLAGIPFGQSREEVGVSDTVLAFGPIIHPGQEKNLNRARAAGAISVAVKPPMEKHISGPDFHATPKAGFYKGAGQHHARITLQMTVPGGRGAPRKCLEPNVNRSVPMSRMHAASLKGFVHDFIVTLNPSHRQTPFLPLTDAESDLPRQTHANSAIVYALRTRTRAIPTFQKRFAV